MKIWYMDEETGGWDSVDSDRVLVEQPDIGPTVIVMEYGGQALLSTVDDDDFDAVLDTLTGDSQSVTFEIERNKE